MVRRKRIQLMLSLVMLASLYPLWFAMSKAHNVIYVAEMLLATVLLSVVLLVLIYRCAGIDLNSLKTVTAVSIGIPLTCSILVYLVCISIIYFSPERLGLNLSDLPLLIIAPVLALYFKAGVFLLSIAPPLSVLLARHLTR